METIEIRRLTLKRLSTGENGTFGVLLDGGIPFAVTLEPQWMDNQKNISCIPAGTNICDDTNSQKFGYTFEVKDVPNRTHILFHKGNYTHNTKGCILVGEQFESNCIAASQAGFKEFIWRLRGRANFTLEIQECY